MSKQDISQEARYPFEDAILGMIPEKTMQEVHNHFSYLTKAQLEELSRYGVLSAVILAQMADTTVKHIFNELVDSYQQAKKMKGRMIASFFRGCAEAFADGMLDADKTDA